jgi:chemotaxis protein CheD
MKSLPFKNTRRVIIDPGEYYVSRNPEVISTLLGSCVAACIFDPLNRVFGMNHFLLAYHQRSQSQPIIQSDEGRYGIFAMELLINDLMKMGANRSLLQAKCFGGGNVLQLREDKDNRKTVGDVNVEFIKAFLDNEKIPIVSACLGGSFGRNVHFVGADFSVFVRKIGDQQALLLANEERQYWKRTVDEHEQRPKGAEFW